MLNRSISATLRAGRLIAIAGILLYIPVLAAAFDTRSGLGTSDVLFLPPQPVDWSFLDRTRPGEQESYKLTIIARTKDGTLVNGATVTLWKGSGGPGVLYDHQEETVRGLAHFNVAFARGASQSRQVYVEISKGDLRGTATISLSSPDTKTTVTMERPDNTPMIRLLLDVKLPTGPASAALVNIWHDTNGIDLGPPNYRVEAVRVDGTAEVMVRSDVTEELTIEASKDDHSIKTNISLNVPGKVIDYTKDPRGLISLPVSLQLKKQSGNDILNVDEKNLIDVKFRVVAERDKDDPDTVKPIAGARLVFTYTGVRRVQAEGVSDGNGEVTVRLLAADYAIAVGKEGYEDAASTVRLTDFYRGKTFKGPTIELKKAVETKVASVEVTVKVQNEKDKTWVNDARVVLQGRSRGALSGVYEGRTNAAGEAKILVKENGNFDIEISNSNFETATGQTRILVDDTRKDLPVFRLKAKEKVAETEFVKVTVLAGDKARAPIAGAQVKLGNITASTDKSGDATIKTSFGLESHVLATVSAPGYKSKTQSIKVQRGVTYSNASATANVVLEPGEDPPSDASPIELVVVVQDAHNLTPIEGKATVTFTFPAFNRMVKVDTNSSGEARFRRNQDESDLTLADIRQGIALDVQREGYLPVQNRTVPASLLAPSNEPRRFSVLLDRDWTALEKDLNDLAPKVRGWNANRTRSSETVLKRTQDLSNEIAEHDKHIDRLVREILTFPKECKNAVSLRGKIDGYRANAAAKESELTTLLSTANQKADSCKVAGDAAVIRANYQSAISLLGEIGAIEKKAVSDVNGVAAEASTRATMITEVKDRLKEINLQFVKAEALLTVREPEISRDLDAMGSLSSQRTTLLGELSTIKIKHKTEQQNIGVPATLKKTIDDLTAILSASDNLSTKPEIVRSRDILNDVQRKLAAMKNLIPMAEKHVNAIETESCGFDHVKPTLAAISGLTVSATTLVGFAADLPRRADACAAGSACRSMTAELTSAIDSGNTAQAESILSKMEDLGLKCDTATLKRRIDAENERDAANAIAPLVDSCRFQDAVVFASQFPASVAALPAVSRLVEKAKAGAQAEKQIIQLIENADKTNDISIAKANVTEARRIAAPFPCLSRALKDSVKKEPPVVEDIPEDFDVNQVKPKTENIDPRTAKGSIPQVEDLPEDRNPAPKPNSTGRTTGKPVPMQKVEELPEDAEPIKPKTNRGNTIKPTKTSDDEEEEEVEQTTTPVQKSQEPKKPGFWQRAGQVAGAIAEGLNTANQTKTGGNLPQDNSRNTPPQDTSCSSADREVWEKISGTWQAKYGYVTFSGSCGNVTGFWMQGTFGHPLRKDGTDQRGEIKEGKVRGGSLSFQYFQPWGDQRKGSDSCSLYVGDKQVSCSYLGTLSR